MKKKSKDGVTVLVIDRDGEMGFARRKMAVLPVLAECRGLPYVAKTMNLVKGDDGYGFLLRQERLASSRRPGEACTKGYLVSLYVAMLETSRVM